MFFQQLGTKIQWRCTDLLQMDVVHPPLVSEHQFVLELRSYLFPLKSGHGNLFHSYVTLTDYGPEVHY